MTSIRPRHSLVSAASALSALVLVGTPVSAASPPNHIVGKAFMAVESYDDTLASVGEGFLYGCPGLRV